MENEWYLITINDPRDFGIDKIEGVDIVEVRKLCIHIYHYKDQIEALNAFAETPCMFSKLFDDLYEGTMWGYYKFAEVMLNVTK